VVTALGKTMKRLCYYAVAVVDAETLKSASPIQCIERLSYNVWRSINEWGLNNAEMNGLLEVRPSDKQQRASAACY